MELRSILWTVFVDEARPKTQWSFPFALFQQAKVALTVAKAAREHFPRRMTVAEDDMKFDGGKGWKCHDVFIKTE